MVSQWEGFWRLEQTVDIKNQHAEKIVAVRTGGQTGADRGAMDAALVDLARIAYRKQIRLDNGVHITGVVAVLFKQPHV